jgi:S1-C subfamily serine protease
VTVIAGLGAAAWARGPIQVPGFGGSGYESSAGGGLTTKTQGYLGVDIRDVGDERIAALKLKESRGAEIIRVDHDGPAGKAGLREHDVILQMNGTVIEGEDQLRRMLREAPAGRAMTLVISRDGQQQMVTTQLGNRLEVERRAWEQMWRVPEPSDQVIIVPGPAVNGQGAAPAPSASGGSPTTSNGSNNSNLKGEGFFSPGGAARSGRNLIGALSLGSSYTGAMVETMGPQLAEFFGTNGGGVLVHSVDANSPAANAGLHAGDVVVRVNSTRMTSTSDWLKVVRENRGKPVQVVVLRDKKEQTLTLVPEGKKRSSLEHAPGGDRGPQPALLARVGFSFR